MKFSVGRKKKNDDVVKRERRSELRTPSNARAYVYRPELPRFKGEVKNLSATGAFVAIGPLPIRNRHVIRLNLVLDLGTVVQLHNRRAIIMRRSREGLGLKFF